MSEAQSKQVNWQRMLDEAGPYPPEAFYFVRDGLTYTVQRVHDDMPMDEIDRHICGQQLCMGLRDFAIERYGLLAPTVLEHMQIKRTDDFGRIVFAMINEGLMSKTDRDTFDDFRSVFDFSEAFSESSLQSHLGAPLDETVSNS